MRIIADENIPGLEETFGRFGSILRCKGREISCEDVRHADVLLVRSVTQVDEQLLRRSSVRYVGSATIGFDHVDTAYLQRSGIHFCHAPGCNADAAAQYTLAMILLAARKSGRDLSSVTAGIVGLGNVGSRLYRLLSIMGVKQILACDPPLADQGQKDLVNLRQIAACDLISFHVPLIADGPYATKHMGDHSFFSKLNPSALVINSSRGTILEASSIDDWLNEGKGLLALDVWPEEPVIDGSLLNRVIVATPHVAGYSLDGKLNGTRMLFRQFLDWLGTHQAEPLPPYPPNPVPIDLSSAKTLEEVILAVCPVEPDDQLLRESLRLNGKLSASEFDTIRKNYRNRRDFAGMLPQGCPEHFRKALKQLGFAQISH